MARRRNERKRPKSNGFALLGLLVILTMGTLYFFVDQLTPALVASIRQKKTEATLSEARDALVGYALRYRDEQIAQGQFDRVDGYLPLPDLGTLRNNNAGCTFEGCDAANFTGNAMNATVIGRLPWRTLGVGPLRDGQGECLWYAISGSHQRQQRLSPMNWDTLSQLEVVAVPSSDALASKLISRIASPHDRPMAIIFSPGPVLSGSQNRGATDGNSVTECGGNYDPRNYLDPSLATALLGYNAIESNAVDDASMTYFSGATSVDTSANRLAFAKEGKIMKETTSGRLRKNCQEGSNCIQVGNDIGLEITPDYFFGKLSKYSVFRSDIDNLIAATGTCLENTSFEFQPTAGAPDGNHGKIKKSPDPDLFKDCVNASPASLGYFENFRDQFLVALANDVNACKNNFDVPNNCLDVTIQDTAVHKKCHGVLIFAGQRGSGQSRASDTERTTPAHYLEGNNLLSFTNAGRVSYSGTRQLGPMPAADPAYRDIVRCIPEAGYSSDNPTGAAFVAVQNTALTTYGGPLARYDTTTATLSLGLKRTSANFPSGVQTDLYGCAWQADSHAFGSGLRSYFQFRINDDGVTTTPIDGFSFAVVDGDLNGLKACGAARQHLGYSGNNLDTPTVKPPKIGIEFDFRRNAGFNPSGGNTLTNGRNDPNYTGGHVGIVYWGGDANIATTTSLASCTAPRKIVGGVCVLPPEEDDNVHGYPPTPTSCRPAPANPVAPVIPTVGAGVYKLDPNLSAVPTNKDFHVRVEITRSASPEPATALPTVRALAATNLDIAAPGASIDGVSLIRDDRILLTGQSNARANGVYVWSAAASGMVRASDFDEAGELTGAIIRVTDGIAYAGSTWRQTAVRPAPDSQDQYWAELRVRLASQSAVNLAAPGANIDGVTLSVGDRVLVKAQSSATENGVYLWNGPASAMSRAADADTGAKRTGMEVQVSQGTDARTWWRSWDGSVWARQSVRVSTPSNIDLANPGATLDGCTAMAAGDRVLVRKQTDARQNGIYVWNGAASALTRATDADTADEAGPAIVRVTEGTDVGRAFRQSAALSAASLDTQTQQWPPLDPGTSPNFVVRAWLLPDSATDANRIAAMKDTSRPMSMLYPSFSAQLYDAPTIYQAFRNARIGFTIGQSTSRNDETVSITKLFTTWLP